MSEQTASNLLVKHEFQAAGMARTSVSLRRSNAPGIERPFVVIRSLPAGEDIGPDYWRYTTEQEADSMFKRMTEWMQNRGYKLLG